DQAPRCAPEEVTRSDAGLADLALIGRHDEIAPELRRRKSHTPRHSRCAILSAGQAPSARGREDDAMGKIRERFGRPQRRRDFLIRTAPGAIAAAALLPRTAFAADPVNIGALYPVTGSFAQIGQGCVNAAKLAVQMVNDAGGIKSLGGAKLNLIVSDVQ